MSREIRRRCGDPGTLGDAGIHPLLARLYSARGVVDSAELELGLAQLIPPAQLLNADRAAQLLADSLAAQQRILVIGDFDADGATSSALAVSVLRAMGAAQADYLVPNRFEYGYGLTPEIVALAQQHEPDLIVTVDNGISSIDGVAAARAAGIATLVTDHHLAGPQLPAADVIVNPNQPGCGFPSKHLAGVGVIFYVMLALRAELRKRQWFEQRGLAEPNLANWLDLVALGTVADVVPLDRNNRILVDNGLRRMRAGQLRPGLQALLRVARRDCRQLVASDLGFAVGPRLNAAGRLDDMSVGIECLLSEEPAGAATLAGQLNQLNLDRRVIEQGMQAEALQQLEQLGLAASADLPLAITLYDPGWHQGVIGILASRIKDRLHRPAIAFARGEQGQLKGSARSIKGLHIRDILDAVATRQPQLIQRFGGHAMAAGLTIEQDNYEPFARAFVAEVTRHAEDVNLQAVIDSDGELQSTDFNLEVAALLRYAGPWGQHFPEPLFDGEFQLLQQRLVGEKHLKLVVQGGNPEDPALDAIAFNVDTGAWPDPSVERVRLAYRLDINEFRGNRALQLVVEQVEPV
jgi:single-stranded-DNA-specific exonuclease